MTPSSSPWRTLALTSVAVFVVSLDGTVLFVAFPAKIDGMKRLAATTRGGRSPTMIARS